MSKKSIVARQIKREKMVAKFADLRAKLKSEGNWEELDKLPKNSCKERIKNRGNGVKKGGRLTRQKSRIKKEKKR